MKFLRKFKISIKIPIAISIFGIALLVLTLISINSMSGINAGGQVIYDNYFSSVIDLTEIRKQSYEKLLWIKRHIISKDDQQMYSAEEQIKNSSNKLQQAIEGFKKTLDAGEETRLFEVFLSDLNKLNLLQEKILALSRTNGGDVEADSITDGEYFTLFVNIQKQIEAMVQTNVDGGEEEYSGNQDNYDNSKLFLVILAVISILVGSILSFGIVKSVQKPIDELQDNISHIVTTKDLTRQLSTQGKDEITEVNKSVNRLVESLINIINDTQSSLNILSEESSSLEKITVDNSAFANNISEKLGHVNHSAEEISSSIQDISQNAATAATAANDVDEQASSGKQTQVNNMSAIENLKTNMKEASSSISEAETKSEDIGSILDVIKNIADQTNLLALNAAIEAARAGEQGRGFAVVADEVRTLAQKTQDSISEIHASIEAVQAATNGAVSQVKESEQSLEESYQLSQDSEQSLNAIAQSIENMKSMNEQIATASEQQNAVMVNINASVTSAYEAGEQVQSSSEELQKISTQISGVIENFRVTIAKYKV